MSMVGCLSRKQGSSETRLERPLKANVVGQYVPTHRRCAAQVRPPEQLQEQSLGDSLPLPRNLSVLVEIGVQPALFFSDAQYTARSGSILRCVVHGLHDELDGFSVSAQGLLPNPDCSPETIVRLSRL